MKKNLNYILFGLSLIFLSLGNVSAAGSCISCGVDTLPIPEGIPNFISKLITLVQIMVPIILIIVGMVKYLKVVTSGEDKMIKETNASFIRSVATGVAIFLVVAIVKFAFSLLGTDGDSALGCVSCFISGDNCSTVTCPKRGETFIPSDTDSDGVKYETCSDYTSEGTCPIRDSENNTCVWNTSTSRCEASGTAKHCGDYSAEDCPEGKSSDYGYVCKVQTVGGRPQCVSYEEGKHCGDYSAEDCPEGETSDYGYICKVQTVGGRPQCVSYERDNKK